MAKKITAIVSLSIIGILIIATIIMANITINHNINCDEPNRIWVVSGSSSVANANAGRILDPEDDEYKTILDLVNSASKEKLLTAIFAGTASDKAEIKEVENTTNKSITSPSSAGYSYFVCFEYSNPQTLMNGGKKFVDANGKNYYYGGLFFGVKNVAGTNVFDVYVNAYENYPYGNNGSNVSYRYHYYYELSANFEDLYSYLKTKTW